MDCNLQRVSCRVKEKLEKAHYSPNTLRSMDSALKRFTKYAEQRGEESLSEELVDDYVRENHLAGKTGWANYLLRSVAMMCDECDMHPSELEEWASRRGSKRKYAVPTRFMKDYESYCKALMRMGLSEQTIRSKECGVRQFLAFLDNRIDGLESLELADCDAFFAAKGETLQQRSSNLMHSSVKSFVDFLKGQYGLSNLAFALRADKRKTPARELQRFLTKEEACRLLEAAAQRRLHPKRTLFVISMMLQYMIRAIDLRNLMLDNIDWLHGCIKIRASKNGKQRTFPLTESLRYVILDYLKNERPESTYRNVLLSCQYPYDPLKSTQTLTVLVQQVAREAGIEMQGKRMGCHALRRTGATMLMSSGVDYSVISDVLMHDAKGSTSNMATMVYLKIDIERLRLASLEVTPYGG